MYAVFLSVFYDLSVCFEFVAHSSLVTYLFQQTLRVAVETFVFLKQLINEFGYNHDVMC